MIIVFNDITYIPITEHQRVMAAARQVDEAMVERAYSAYWSALDNRGAESEPMAAMRAGLLAASEEGAMNNERDYRDEELVTGATYRFAETPENLSMLRALDTLYVGLRDRRLEVKGDGDWVQMVKTVLLLVDQQQPLFKRMEELGQQIKHAEADLAALRGAAQALSDYCDDDGYPGTSGNAYNECCRLITNLRAVLISIDSESREKTP